MHEAAHIETDGFATTRTRLRPSLAIAGALHRLARPQTPRALPENPYRAQLPRDVDPF